MKFSTLPEIAQDALRDKFIAETEAEFNELEPELLDQFLLCPDIQTQWLKYRERAYDNYMNDDDAVDNWHSWLEDNGVDPH